jgi:hypothetical protein
LPPKVIEKADIQFSQPDLASEESLKMLSPPIKHGYRQKQLFSTITKIASDNNTNSYLENIQATQVI